MVSVEVKNGKSIAALGGRREWLGHCEGQSGHPRLGTQLPQLFLEQHGGGLGLVLAIKPAQTQPIEQVKNGRRHRKGDVLGIYAVLWTAHDK